MSTVAAGVQNKVIHGDCLEVMPSLPDKSIDMILCDLPYGTTACKWDSIIPFETLWEQYKRLIRDSGAIVLMAREPFTSVLVCSNLQGYKHKWVWNKKQSGSPQNAKYMPLQVDEDIIVFGDGLIKYYPIMRTGEYRKKGGNKRHNQIMNDGWQDGFSVYNNQYHPINIIDMVNPRINKLHPTQKPVELFEYLIKTYTNEGETVLDNCAGSGTTAIACLNINRNYILIEKEKEYIDIINKRISEHEIQVSIC